MKWRARLIIVSVVAFVLAFVLHHWRQARLESSQDKNILLAARKYSVEPALIKAVIWRESKFDAHARGAKGEVGLMQIMENAGRDWAGAQRVPAFAHPMLRDPEKNIDCGTWYLHKSLLRYAKTDDPVPYALADYNAGRGNVLKWIQAGAATNSAVFIEQIGFPSTRDYVRAVMQQREKYQGQFRESAP